MLDHKTLGRWIGASMLLSFAIGLYSNFKLQTDLFAGPGLLEGAAQHPYKIGLIVVLGLISGLLSVWVAALLSANFHRSYPVMLKVYFALAIVTFAASVLEHSTLLAFRRLSETYLAAGPEQAALFQPARSLLSSLRNGIHFLHVLLGGLGVALLFAFLLRARLLPRGLAVLGIAAAAAQVFTVGRPLFGFDVIYPLLAPLAQAYLATLCWLLFKGFAEPVEGPRQERPAA